jgi:hypothetical protein
MIFNKDNFPPKGTILILENMAEEIHTSETLDGLEKFSFNSFGNTGKVIVLDSGMFQGRSRVKVLFLDNGITGWIHFPTDYNWENMIAK